MKSTSRLALLDMQGSEVGEAKIYGKVPCQKNLADLVQRILDWSRRRVGEGSRLEEKREGTRQTVCRWCLRGVEVGEAKGAEEGDEAEETFQYRGDQRSEIFSKQEDHT